MQVVELTNLKNSLVEFVTLFYHITPGPLLFNFVFYYLRASDNSLPTPSYYKFHPIPIIKP